MQTLIDIRGLELMVNYTINTKEQSIGHTPIIPWRRYLVSEVLTENNDDLLTLAIIYPKFMQDIQREIDNQITSMEDRNYD